MRCEGHGWCCSCARSFWGQDASPRGSAHWPLGPPAPLIGSRRRQDTVPLGVSGPRPPGDAPERLLKSQGETLPFLSLQPGHLGALLWEGEKEIPSHAPAVCALDELDLETSVMSTTFSLEQASHAHLCPPRGPWADCGWWEGLRGKSSGHGESYLASDLHFFLKKDLPLASSSILSHSSCSNSLASSNPPPREHPPRLVPSCRAFRPSGSCPTPSPAPPPPHSTLQTSLRP